LWQPAELAGSSRQFLRDTVEIGMSLLLITVKVIRDSNLIPVNGQEMSRGDPLFLGIVPGSSRNGIRDDFGI